MTERSAGPDAPAGNAATPGRAPGASPGVTPGAGRTLVPPAIGPYRLIEIIGEGGMGVVWLAEQLQPVRRQVALKIVRAELDSEEVLARFDAERQAVALMNHPCIAQVYDAGRTADGVPYFVMEYVPGLPLTEFCDRRELDLRARLALFADVCRGVHHAHQKGILHRDLKPSNVLVALVDGRPVPKIIDFGVAKATQPLPGSTPLAERGRFIGTPSYMSPEQADPTALGVDSRTDVYSLGVLLYELLVGELPFDPRHLSGSELADLPRLIREQTPSRPSTRLRTGTANSAQRAAARADRAGALARRVRGDLDAIALKALQKDPERRYASASELALDVERHLRGQPVAAGPQHAGYRAGKFLVRHRMPVLAAAAVLASLVVGLTFAWRQYRAAQASEALAELNRGLAEQRATEASALLGRAQAAEGEAQAALERERAARGEADGRRLGAQSLALAEDAPTLALLLAIEGYERAPGEDTRRALHRALDQHRELAQFDGHEPFVGCCALSPDGRRLISGDASGLLIVRDAATGEHRQRLDEHTSGIVACGFLPDGRSAFSVSSDGLALVWDLAAGGAAVRSRLQLPAPAAGAVLAAGGAVLVAAGRDGVVRGWDLFGPLPASAPGPRVLATHAPGPLLLAASGDGRRVASIGPDMIVHVFDPSEPEGAASPASAPLRIALSHGEPPAIYNVDHEAYYPPQVALSADGRRLLARSRDGQVALHDATTGAELRRCAAPGEFLSYAALSPDGRRVFVCRHNDSGPGTGEILDAESGRLVTRLTGDGPGVRGSARFLPDGEALLTSTNNVHDLWDATTGQHRARMIGAPHGESAPAFFADGERFASCGADGRVRIFGLSAVRENWRLADLEAAGEIDVVATSPDGELAVVRRRGVGPAAIELLDAPSGRRLHELLPPAPGEVSARFSSRADLVALVSADGLRVWDVTARRVLLERAGPVRMARFSGDGGRLAVAEGDRIDVHETRTGALLASMPGAGQRAYEISLSRDGALLATADGGQNTATLWDVAAGRQLARIPRRGFVFSAAFDPGGARLLTFANDTAAQVNDVQSGRVELVVRRLPTSEYGAASWSPDGRLFAVVTTHDLQLFEAATGAPVASWKPREGRFGTWETTFTPDGRNLLCQLEGGVLRFLPLDPLVAARAAAPRRLTAAEMATFGVGTVEEQAARAAELEASLTSAADLTSLAQHALEAGNVAHALVLLERASACRRHPPPGTRFQLARALMQRARSRPQTAEGASGRVEDEARALRELAALGEAGELARDDLALTQEFEPLQGRAEFAALFGAARP